jgi:colanic acid/amylovoran biosynthesis protein
MHVIIENTVALNTGDAAILVAIIDIVRETFGADTRISVCDSEPQVAARLYPELSFHPLMTATLSGDLHLFGRSWRTPLRRWLAKRQRANWQHATDGPAHDSLALYRSADLVISTGGTYLVEHYKLRNRFDELDKDIALGKSLVLFTQSLGPFSQPDNRARMKRIADAALLVLLRDAKSREHLREIGVTEERLEVVADSVFALARADWLAAPPPRASARPLRVAVSVRRWTHFDGHDRDTGMQRYEAAIAGAVTALVRERGAEVVFLSTCQGVPEYLYDDSQVADRIRDGLDADVQRAVSVDRDFHSPAALMLTLRGFDFAISTRMHMAILGLCAGLPVLPIAYEFKTTEVYKSIDQGEWVTDISAIEREPFVALALRFAQRFAEFRSAVAPHVLEQAASARSAGVLIAQRLARSAQSRQ